MFSELEQLGIAHRDLKPDNILIKKDKDDIVEKFAVCDFSEGKKV